MRRVAREAALFALAVQFLTRIPVPAVPWSQARMTAALRHFPLVGLAIGASLALVFWAASSVWDPVLGAVAVVAVGLCLTGAFHEDGFADFCDALGGHVSKERALEIMKDSRLGTYGSAGLFIMLGARVAALASAGPAALWLLPAGQGASRASAVLAATTGPYVRTDGTGRVIAARDRSARIGPGGLAWAMLTGLGALALLGVLGWQAVLGGAIGLILGHVAIRAIYQRRLGGWTGDCLGAVQQASELGLYLGALACL